MGETTKKSDAGMFQFPMITCCGSYEDVLADVQALYNKQREAFFSGNANDDDVPEKAEAWAKVSKRLIQAAASEMCMYPAEAERQEKALQIIDTCKNDAFLREANLLAHYQIAEEAGLEGKDLMKKFDAFLKGVDFCTRARNTQIYWVRKFMHGDTYEPAEMKYYRKYGGRTYTMMQRIPDGHRFWPARIFPRDRVPAGQRVPYTPAVFKLWKALPQEDLVFDEEHDEFVLPKGYVSRDGRIDDQSVVFNWEDRTVTMKFVGDEPVTWSFWKARNDGDLPEAGSWAEEYMIRVRKQLIEDLEPPGCAERETQDSGFRIQDSVGIGAASRRFGESQ